MTEKTFLVISHTHWDREWYLPFEKFRMKLVDLINNLLVILKEYPDYIFHLDAQTIVLEDYFEIYPENRSKIEKYIKSGNLVVGPWYVQNDFFLSSGESTIRNLLIGSRIAESFGKCAMVGYTPDQFGLPSQLPQIFSGFGISSHLFGRGYAFYKSGDSDNKLPTDCDFYWESPDGSRVFSVMMPFWYNNAQRISSDLDVSLSRLERAEEDFSKISDSPYLLMMNGVDHLEAQEDLLPILEQMNTSLKNRVIMQANMEESLEKIKPYAKDKVVKGELRYGKELDVLTGTLSTRVDIKKKNFDTQNMIERQVEPLYSMLMLAGAKNIYPQNQINYMWKLLIPNHAHDSICCCSNGNVMRHMENRYLSIQEIGEELLQRGAKFLNHHIRRNDKNDGEYYLTVINTSQTNYSGVMDISVDINIQEDKGSFKILTEDNVDIKYVVLNRKSAQHATFSPLNLPGNVEVVSYDIQVYVQDIPAFGYVNYRVVPCEEKRIEEKAVVLENEYLKVDFNDECINLLDKINGNYYRDVLSFEDVGDAGDSYIFVSMENDEPIKGKLVNRQICYQNVLKSQVLLEYVMDVPYEKNGKKRSGNAVQNRLKVYLSLGKGERALDVSVQMENNSKYHLIRASVNTGVSDDISYASSVFDVIRRDSRDVDAEFRNPTQPVNGFVYKKDDKKGFAVYTKGLYEYENTEQEILKLSLLRSVDMISNVDSDERAWGVKENLMLGNTEVTFALMPFGDDASSVHAMEQNVCYQPVYWCDSTNIKMFTGGRPAVQSGDVDKLYFEKDSYESMQLPYKNSFINVNKKVCVTSLKKAEKTQQVVLRMFNPSDDKINGIIKTKNAIKTDLKEEKRERFSNCIDKKEILSLFISD